MTFGYLRHDDSGHWYLVPEEHIEEYDMLMDQVEELDEDSHEWAIAVDKVNACYWKYRIDGIYDLRVVMNKST